ncbi:hypothetical protein ACWEKM_16280 [Streptomyces sp. NPDC004752]
MAHSRPHATSAQQRPVVDADLIGTERIVHFQCGQQTVRMRLRADEPVPAQITAHAPADRVHRFDSEGNRIEGRS